jgi:hypothetical protein
MAIENTENNDVLDVDLEIENTESVAEKEAAEEKKAELKKKASKKKATGAIVSNAVKEEDESIDQILDRLIAEEASRGNLIGSLSADIKDATPNDLDSTKVAVFSSRNASWGGYGSIYKGYNILSKRRADAWLTRSHVRTATPAEIAQNLR